MVKGLSRRVVVLNLPSSEIFEQAFFIVSEDIKTGTTAKDVISEAYEVLNSRNRVIKQRTKPGQLFYYLAGAFSVALAWGLTVIFL